jgi:prophage antirepressor-like protein
MEEIKIFNHKMFGEIRAMTAENGEVLFVGKDVAKALGYAKPENAIAVHVDKEDKTSTLIQGSGSNYKSKAVLINESGLYSLILSSCTQRRSALPLATASYVFIQTYLVNIL